MATASWFNLIVVIYSLPVNWIVCQIKPETDPVIKITSKYLALEINWLQSDFWFFFVVCTKVLLKTGKTSQRVRQRVREKEKKVQDKTHGDKHIKRFYFWTGCVLVMYKVRAPAHSLYFCQVADPKQKHQKHGKIY